MPELKRAALIGGLMGIGIVAYYAYGGTLDLYSFEDIKKAMVYIGAAASTNAMICLVLEENFRK